MLPAWIASFISSREGGVSFGKREDDSCVCVSWLDALRSQRGSSHSSSVIKAWWHLRDLLTPQSTVPRIFLRYVLSSAGSWRPGAEGSLCDRVLKGRCTPEEQLYILGEEEEGAGVSERQHWWKLCERKYQTKETCLMFFGMLTLHAHSDNFRRHSVWLEFLLFWITHYSSSHLELVIRNIYILPS